MKIFSLLVICLSYLQSSFQNICVKQVKFSDEKETSVQAKWAIVALTRPGRADMHIRNDAIARMLKPYAKDHHVDALFFSEKKFPRNIIENVINTFSNVASVKFINTIDRGFNLPERYGYKYMCKFFALDIYDYLSRYDYYMRCDTDCYIKLPSFDLLHWAESNNVGYGYAIRKLEAHGITKTTMPPWIDQYVSNCNLQPTAIMDRPLSVCFNFYNNWHIGRVAFFLRPDVHHFLLSVNASGHILKSRWGDSTVQAYAVRLFMDPRQILRVPNFSYVHGSHGDRRVSTEGSGLTNVPQLLPTWKFISG